MFKYKTDLFKGLLKDEQIINFQIVEQYKLLTNAAQCKLFVLLYDVRKSKSHLEYLKLILDELKERKGYCRVILLATKIDLLKSAGFHFEEGLLQGWLLSKKYSFCKFMPLSLTDDEYCERTMETILFLHLNPLSIIDWRENENQMDNLTLIFDDYWPVSQEAPVFVTITAPASEVPLSCDEPYYAVIKGHFLFLFHQKKHLTIRILYLRCCEFTAEYKTSVSLTFTIPDGTKFKIVTQSPKSLLDTWPSNIKSPIESFSVDNNSSTEEENLSFFKRLENELTSAQTKTPLSSLYNVSHRIKCVDCNQVHCPFISKGNCVFLCDNCANIHSSTLNNRNAKVCLIYEFKARGNLGPKTNEYFNISWEGIDPGPQKITPLCTTNQRTLFIKGKYNEFLFYSCPMEPLEVKELDNWIERFLWVEHNGTVTLYEDGARSKELDSYHVSWCTFRTGKDLDLDPQYLHLIGPGSSNLFRTASATIAERWKIILSSAQLRTKKQYRNYTVMNLPRQSLRGTIRLKDTSAVSSSNVKNLILEKSHLISTRKLRVERIQRKQKLLQLLQETELEIEGLEASESNSISKISDLEPFNVLLELQQLRAIVGIHSEIYESLKNDNTLHVVTPRFVSPDPLEDNALQNIIKETLDSNYKSIFILGNTGNVKAATTNRLIYQLIDSSNEEIEYTDILLNTFPYFMTPSKFVQTICKLFASANLKPHLEMKSNIDKTNSERVISVTADCYTLLESSDLSVLQIRKNLLDVLEVWMSCYWTSDLAGSPGLIIYLISFIDYIAQPIPGLQLKVDCIRNLLEEKYRLNAHVNSPLPRANSLKLANRTGFSIGQFVMETDTNELARQLSLNNQNLFVNIQARELLDKAWTRPDCMESSINVIALKDQFNKITDWVSTCIVLQAKTKQRIKLLDKFIHLAIHCKELNNFHSLVAIIGGLRDPAVARCRKTWRGLSVKLQTAFDNLVNLISVHGNWVAYRQVLKSTLDKREPCVPYIGVFLKDLVFIEDGLPSTLTVNGDKEIVNFEKNRKVAEVIKQIRLLQVVSYDIQKIPNTYNFLDSTLTSSPLLTEAERYNQSLLIEPKPKKKKTESR